jgi:hypothetical protein
VHVEGANDFAPANTGDGNFAMLITHVQKLWAPRCRRTARHCHVPRWGYLICARARASGSGTAPR